jgi:hypothetical protein
VLRLEAWSTDGSSVLDVFDHGSDVYIGSLPAGGGCATFCYAPYAAFVRVQSDLGGVAISPVDALP